MKFTETWASVLYANSVLKITTVVLGVITTILTFATIRLSLKDPLIIDRQCFSSIASPAKNSHTSGEVETFSKLALERRFNSDAQDPRVFIGVEESLNRKREQEEFKIKSIFQKIIVNSIKVEGTKVKVDADRILSTGKIKTIIPFPIQLELTESERSESNPYGLVLSKVSLIKEEKP